MKQKFEEGVCYGRLERKDIRELLFTAKSEYLRGLAMNLLEEAAKFDCEFLILSAKKLEVKSK